MSHPQRPILIAGGGPVGVIAALALARQNIPVQLFEAEDRVSDAPRAATTHPATLEMLSELGLVEEVIQRGLIARTFQFWDRASRELIAEFDHAVLAGDTAFPFIVQCEQHKLANMALERLRAYPHAEVQFSARVLGRALDDHVDITVKTAAGSRSVSGSYLIGADGGRSSVRKALGIEFEGHVSGALSGPDHAIRFRRRWHLVRAQLFLNPDEWASLFKVAGDDGSGLWRVVFPTRPHETNQQALNEAVQRRLLSSSSQRALSGGPPQPLSRAPARRGDFRKGPRLPGGRRRAYQQSDRGSASTSAFATRSSSPIFSAASSAARRRPTRSTTTTGDAAR